MDDDNDFDFADDTNHKPTSTTDNLKGRALNQQKEDYEVEVSDDDDNEVPSDPEPEPEPEPEQEDESQEESPVRRQAPQGRFQPIRASGQSEDHEEEGSGAVAEGAYDPSHYANLNVGQDVADLFKYITRFKPTAIDLETAFKPFIPDFIPAIGEVDAFLKPSRPDEQQEALGLNVVDEPTLNQSKAEYMWALIHKVRPKPKSEKRNVHAIEDAERKPKEITEWIKNVEKLPRHAPEVVYTRKFPDIDQLMEVWPAEIEEALQHLKIPTEEVDMSLEEYARLCCGILDIPVHPTTDNKNLVESLSVLFNLYGAFQANQHFQKGNEQFVYDGSGANGPY